MKKLIFVPAFFLCLLQFLAGFLLLSGDNRSAQPDSAAVNAAVQSAAIQWEGLLAGQAYTAPEELGDADYSIITKGERVLSSKGGEYRGIFEAVRNRDTMVDINRDGVAVGTFVLHNDIPGLHRQEQKRLFFLLFVFTVLELTVITGLTLYIDRLFIRPFSKLRAFAVRVAGGDLDFPLVMDKKNVFGAFTESFDLMREELKKARADEMAAVRSKKELVAKLSHDIKTPVASIQAVSELMTVSAGTEREKKQLTVIGSKAKQIDSLVSELFETTLEELDELTVTTAVHSSRELETLIRQADYRNRAALKDIPECLLCFDDTRLLQVLDNVFANSYKYADTPVEVSFSLRAGELMISIADEGPGADEEELPLLCGKFYRGKNAGEKNGAGLGLYISSCFLIRMGGKLSCRNTENGFCVEIRLRLA